MCAPLGPRWRRSVGARVGARRGALARAHSARARVRALGARGARARRGPRATMFLALPAQRRAAWERWRALLVRGCRCRRVPGPVSARDGRPGGGWVPQVGSSAEMVVSRRNLVRPVAVRLLLLAEGAGAFWHLPLHQWPAERRAASPRCSGATSSGPPSTGSLASCSSSFFFFSTCCFFLFFQVVPWELVHRNRNSAVHRAAQWHPAVSAQALGAHTITAKTHL